MKTNSRIIIACDFTNKKNLNKFLFQMGDKKLFLKLGMQLLYKEGFDIINCLQEKGHNIFIDLKLHDIPNTVASALHSLRDFEPDFIDIHALGGRAMLTAAKKVFKDKKTKILAITVLTSINDASLQEMGLNIKVEQLANHLMQLCSDVGIDGVVCSAHEAHIAKKMNLLAITPGIRPINEDIGDQLRIATPKNAIDQGADFLVIGRPIIESDDPLKAYQKIQNEIGEIDEKNCQNIVRN